MIYLLRQKYSKNQKLQTIVILLVKIEELLIRVVISIVTFLLLCWYFFTTTLTMIHTYAQEFSKNPGYVTAIPLTDQKLVLFTKTIMRKLIKMKEVNHLQKQL